MSDGLFDIPDDAYVIPPSPEDLTRGERRKRLVEKRIAQGLHPLGYVRLHPEAPRGREGDGPRCGECRFRVVTSHHNKSYPKCHLPVLSGGKLVHLRDTGCESSDIRAWWPACVDYAEAPS